MYSWIIIYLGILAAMLRSQISDLIEELEAQQQCQLEMKSAHASEISSLKEQYDMVRYCIAVMHGLSIAKITDGAFVCHSISLYTFI